MPTRALLCVLVLAACDGASEKASAPAGAPPESKAGSESIGAFDEYKRKSIAGEARTVLRQIAMGARMAFEEERFVDGAVTTGNLPPSAPLTPAAGTCCKQPKGRCPAQLGAWDHPTWRAIGFDPPEAHYYSYELATDAKGFVARAVGDLDCDGELSTFEIAATIVDGRLEVGELKVDHELE